jgi:hypothetical protein
MPRESRTADEQGDREARDRAADALADREPWEHGRSPGERPRHENAVPEDPDDPVETSAAIDAASWGEVVEVSPGDTVDGDFNGAPQLEALSEASEDAGADALDAMEGPDAEAMQLRDDPVPEQQLAGLVADRIEVLAERIDEARELGLGDLVDAVLAAAAQGSGVDELRDLLSRIDAALEQVEMRTAGMEPGGRHGRR